MGSVLAEHDIEVAEEVRNAVCQAGGRIAGKFVKRLKAKKKHTKDQSPKPNERNGKAEEKVEI